MKSAPAGFLPPTNTNAYQVVLPNQVEALEALSDWVSQVVVELGVPGRTAFALDLALTEAVTNVLSYAFPDEGQHEVTVSLSHTPPHLTVEIIDDGQPFDPLNHAPASLPTSLNEASVGGLGIHLIRNYARACHYRRKNNHNILTLVFDQTNA